MALTDEQLEYISDALIPLFQYLEEQVIIDVANRIKESMAYTRTAELEAVNMRKLGYSPARIRKEAMKLLKSDPEYRKLVAKNTLEHKKKVRKLLQSIMKSAQAAKDKILSRAADLSFLDDLRVWKQGGKELTDRSFLPQLVDAARQQTSETLKNMTKTTGFKTMSGFEAVENLYQRELDKAMIKICSGTFSREQVVYDVVHSLAESGLRTIDFSSGYSMQLDTAVKLAIRTGAHQLSGKIMDADILQTGVNLVYVSRHWGARNTDTGHANHEQWQGKVYFIKDGTDYSEEAKRIGQDRIMSLWYATGYSVDGSKANDPLGLYGFNCRHKHHPWFIGVSELTPEDPEPEAVTINGRTYDYYAIEQKKRSMERRIRAMKREREAMKALNMDTKQISKSIKQKIYDYENFCDTAKVKSDINRLRYESDTSDLKKTEAWKKYEEYTATEKKEVADGNGHDTMDISKEKKGVKVHTVGKIDREIYKCVTEDIVTDEVIITDNQIQHIKERHPKDYERFASYLGEIVKNPDYIIEATKPNTALILKSIKKDDEVFKTVLRLVTSTDSQDYKNSIITFMKIDEKEWNRLLRNKKILYKKE